METVLSELGSHVTEQIAPCLTLALFTNEPSRENRLGLVAVFDDYVKRWGKNLQWFAEDETNRFRKFDASAKSYPRRAAKRWEIQPDLVIRWVAYSGEDRLAAGFWRFHGTARAPNAWPEALGFASVSWDVRKFHDRYGKVVETVQRWADSISVHYGYSGLSFNVSQGSIQQRHGWEAKRLAMRFQGFELEDASTTSLCCMTELKGVNWLTIVSHSMLEPLGGLSAIREKCSQEIRIHPMRGGVIIQAGPEPQVGDANRGETLPLYREVARVLKPIRARSHWPFFGNVLGNDWMRRFND